MTEQRDSLQTQAVSPRPLTDLIGGLLSNPAVIEGLIAGISAISASRRTKMAADGESAGVTQQGGGILDILPGLLPLLSVVTNASAPTTAAREPSAPAAPAEEQTDAVPASAEADDLSSLFGDGDPGGIGGIGDIDAADESPDSGSVPIFADAPGSIPVEVSSGNREAQRENLLLAIRPFLSESRRSAADAMVQVNKLSGLFRRA